MPNVFSINRLARECLSLIKVREYLAHSTLGMVVAWKALKQMLRQQQKHKETILKCYGS